MTIKVGSNILLILIISLNSLFGQDLLSEREKQNIDSLVDIIDSLDFVESLHIGLEGEKSLSYSLFEEMYELSDVQQLLELTVHKSSEVRCYAFLGLAKRNYLSIEELLIKHSTDSSKVYVMYGCQVDCVSVFDFMMTVLSPSSSYQCMKLPKRKLKKIKKENTP